MKLLYLFFIFFTAVFLLIQFHPFLGIQLPDWILFYGKDFICMPIILTICLILVRIFKRDPNLHLDLLTVLSLALFYSLYFEVLMPKIHSRYTADFIDVLMYFSGAFLFYFLQDRNKKSRLNFE